MDKLLGLPKRRPLHPEDYEEWAHLFPKLAITEIAHLAYPWSVHSFELLWQQLKEARNQGELEVTTEHLEFELPFRGKVTTTQEWVSRASFYRYTKAKGQPFDELEVGLQRWLRQEPGLVQEDGDTAPSEAGPAPKRKRWDSLHEAMEPAVDRLEAELGRWPLPPEVFNLLATDDRTRLVIDANDEYLMWINDKGEEKSSSLKDVKDRLRRIKIARLAVTE